MSFICDFCKKQQPPKTKPIKIVTEARSKHYLPQEIAEKKEKSSRHDEEYRYERKETRYGSEGNGWEIVKEKNACKECAENN